jgi:hypothetical protein
MDSLKQEISHKRKRYSNVSEIAQNFDVLYCIYSALFPHTNYLGATSAILEKNIPATRGVYLIWRKAEKELIYIGCSGKIKNGMISGAGDVRKRLFGPSTYTPYIFEQKLFKYGPVSRTSGGRPANYDKSISINEIQISVISTPEKVAPAALEHLLIQGYINQHGNLPEANREI